MNITPYTKSGNKATSSIKLEPKIFAIKPNDELLKTAYVAYLANRRGQLAKTKKRGEVRGGGAKPWRQKGTGRARVGSSRNPIWRGGGVAFGPTGQENHSHKLSLKTKRQALRQALSVAVADGRLKVIEAIESQAGKVGPMVNLLEKLETQGAVLLVVDGVNPLQQRATRNLTGVKTVSANYLSVFDLLNADSIVMTQAALKHVTEWLADSAKAGKREATND